MLQREESRHDFAFIAGVVIGAIAGAIVTLALTPMSGDQTREAIRTRVNELPLDDFKHKADDLKVKAQEAREMAVERAAEVKEKAADRASEVAQQAQPMVEKVKAKTPLKDDKDTEDAIDEVAEMVPPPAPTSTQPTS